jgi:aconitate decarboxylase
MSAQFESEVKRMQHGFAARNGLMAALLAKGGYVGIKKVYEREYGGFLDMFSKGNGMSPQFRVEEIFANLSEEWETRNVKVKPYPSMAATHGVIDCIRILQHDHAEEMREFGEVEEIVLGLGEAAFKHGGFDVQRPLTSTGAQMSAKYVAVTQIIDGAVLPSCFRYDMLNREKLWELVERTRCVQRIVKGKKWASDVEVRFKDGKVLKANVDAARGVSPELSNGGIVEKWRGLMKEVITDERRDEIERVCLGIDGLEDITKLSDLLAGLTKNPIA